ncbi:hypothetical protein PAPHI01_1403 [Pancytospora philotis]|nr:hypothetical protein PAPHI01_1403 [Pancytospora philotis]
MMMLQIALFMLGCLRASAGSMTNTGSSSGIWRSGVHHRCISLNQDDERSLSKLYEACRRNKYNKREINAAEVCGNTVCEERYYVVQSIIASTSGKLLDSLVRAFGFAELCFLKKMFSQAFIENLMGSQYSSNDGETSGEQKSVSQDEHEAVAAARAKLKREVTDQLSKYPWEFVMDGGNGYTEQDYKAYADLKYSDDSFVHNDIEELDKEIKCNADIRREMLPKLRCMLRMLRKRWPNPSERDGFECINRDDSFECIDADDEFEEIEYKQRC